MIDAEAITGKVRVVTDEEKAQPADIIPVLSADKIAQIDKQVADLFEAGEEALDEVYDLGQGSLTTSKDFTASLEGKLVNAVDDDSLVAKKLVSLREASSALEIMDCSKKGLLAKGLALLNIDIIKRRIKKIKKNYEATKEVMIGIIESLEDCKTNMVSETNDLAGLKNNLVAQQETVLVEIHAIEAVVARLEGENDDIPEAKRKQLAQAAKVNLMDLKLLYSANEQHIAMLSQIAHDKKIQMQAVNRASGVIMKMSLVGFIIRTALENNRKINEACKASQEFLSEQISANAEMFKDQVKQTRQVSMTPAIQIEKLKKAYDDINTAIEMAAAESEKAELNIKKVIDGIDSIAGSNKRLIGMAEGTMKKIQ
jgi:uncharacterized protein YaaN involved in tellurite resistance